MKLPRREARDAFLFLAPWIIGFVVFTAGPMLASIVLIFTNWEIITPPTFAGLANLRHLIHDPLFFIALGNTLFYVVFYVPLYLLLALLIALAMNVRLRGINFYRVLYYLPSQTPVIASAILWIWIYNPDYGLANVVLQFFHLPPQQWIFDPNLSKPSLILMGLWGAGGGMVIFLAGLQGIPENLHEAAAIDGASMVRRFFSITLPMLSPVIFFQLIIGIVGTFTAGFTQVYVMTSGGPSNSTLLGALTTASMAAYAFSRLRFRWRGALFAVCLSTLMLPNVVTLIPQFILFKDLGWINTFAPLIVPSFFGGGAFNIFLIRQFFLTIPYELEEASRIDGASSFRIWWSIMLPLSKPALGTVAIFSIIFHWNDFLGPLIYLNSQQNYTLALGLQSFQGAYGGDFNLMMAASTVMIIPIMVLFFFAQRFFMQGIVLTGMGGR